MEYKVQQNNYQSRHEAGYRTKGDYYKQSSGGMYDSFKYKTLQTAQGNYN